MTPVGGAAAEYAGPYRLRTMLGEGGMGVVYRAVDEADREVAVKLVRPEFARDESFRRRLAREVETMRRVRSPYVADVLDADVSAGRPYIVTRFIDGRPLDETVRDDGPLSGGPLARVAAGLADALTAIHEAGVVHRDLKPNNVMLVSGAPVVIDFGIAHAADATRLTRTGMIVGTPGYMGPEVMSGGPPGPAVDVYGWAATVAFAATGRSPFGSGSLEGVLARIAAGDPDLEGVPPRLEPFLRRALDRDPERRPSAAQLAVWVREADLGAPAVPAPRPAPESPPAGRSAGERRRVPLRAYKLLAYLVIVAAAAACAALPALGAAAVVAAAWYLRAGDSAVRARRIPVRGAKDLVLAPARSPASLAGAAAMLVPSLAYAGLIAGVLAVAQFALAGSHPATASIISVGAFGFGYVTLAAPRMMAPRRQLVRLLSATAPDRRRTALAGTAIALLAPAAVCGAWVSGPHWWPLTPEFTRLGHLLSDLLSRLPWHA